MASAPSISKTILSFAVLAAALLLFGATQASAADRGFVSTGDISKVNLQVHNGLVAPSDSDGDQFEVTVINYNSFAVNGKLAFYAVGKDGEATGKPLASGGFQLPADGPTTAILLPSSKLEKLWKNKKFKSIPVRAKIALWTNGFTKLGKAEGKYTIVRKLKGNKGAANTTPTLVNSAYTVKEGATLTVPQTGLLTYATDPDYDHLYLKVTQRPKNFKTFNIGADGLFSYVGAANFSGTDTFTYQVFDGTSYSAPATVTITVTPKAPTIAAIADQKINGGDQASAQTVATKSFVSSSIPVTYSFTGTPPTGATIDGATGVITVPSGTVTAGTYNLTLKAQNTAGSTTKAFKLIVKAGKIGSLSALTVVEDTIITPYATAGGFTASAGATYSANGLPTGLSIDNTTGEITGAAPDPGTGSATITITDANGTATQTLAWTIEVD